MKHLTVFLLVLSLLLCGCSVASHNIKEPVDFFYPKVCARPEEYKAYFSGEAIGSESREASGHRDDLFYLLSMYFRGPLDSQLYSPFPTDCSLVKVRQKDGALTVILNASAAGNSDLEQTLAIACLAKTCMALTDADTIHIESRGIDDSILLQYTVDADTLLWEDIPPTSRSLEETVQ